MLHSFRTLMGISRIEVAPKDVSYKELLGYANGIRKRKPDPPPKKEEAQKPKKKPKHLWSEAEDESLEKGYQKHGFCWKDIANDPSLALGDRSGPQIRDRFRKRFPDLYSEVPPPSTNPRHAPSTGVNIAPTSMSKGPDLSFGDQGVYPRRKSDMKKENSVRTGLQTTILPKQTSSASAPQGISSLLNSDEPDNIQSSFRSDDWDGNVTLPPLLWEDLCAKPMFDLD